MGRYVQVFQGSAWIKRWLGLLVLLLGFNPAAWAALTAGDIAFVQYNADNTDNFSFVALVDIPASEEIKFTDNGWKADDTWRTGEGVLTWTAPAGGVSKGTVVAVAASPLALSASGDQVIAYQGTDTMIAALNNQGSATWQKDTTDTNDSALPQGLTNGTNAVALTEVDNAVYTGTTTGDKATLLAAINNPSNWTGDNATNQTFTGIFTVATATPSLMRITEYMYKGDNGEFVEFTNVGSTAINMLGWSFDDKSQAPGSMDLSGFGTVQAGESVILTEASEADFRTAWGGLCDGVKVVGHLSQGLGRGDEINLYDASNALVDRLTYDDEGSGTVDAPRTKDASAWVSVAALGNNTANQWTLSTVGDAESSVASTGGDIGSPSKSTHATVSYDPCTVIADAPTITFNTNTSDYLDGGAASVGSGFAASGTVGTTDTSDPMRTLGVNFSIADSDGVSTTTVTALSSNQTVVPNANLSITGSGTANVNLKIQGAAAGYAVILVTVSDGTYSALFVINYAASAAGTTNSRYHSGKSDASTAISLDSDYMLVADDEDQAIRLFHRNNSGLSFNSFDYTTDLGLTAGQEVDLEASTRVGSTLYWMGSHSNNKSGNDKPERERLFSTTLSGGTGASSTLEDFGAAYYQFLEDDLVAWDSGNTHGLGADFFGLSASVTGVPEATNGFSIEGFSVAPGSSTTAYIAFRAPIVPATSRTKALIVPVTNFTTILDGSGGTTGSAAFGTPIQLDLGGRGIRSLECSNDGCLIIAGASDASGNFKLYRWSGNAADAPVAISTDLSTVAITGSGNEGSFESIVSMPTGAMNTWDGQQIQVLLDNGDSVYYGDATVAKDLAQERYKKFRSETVTLIESNITKIHTIQGIGSTVTGAGPFTVEAIVTADYQDSATSIKGFFIQEENADADANPATSEAIFVYCNTCPIAVSVGDKVEITGTASDFQDLSQLTPTSISVISSANTLPTSTTITLPVPNGYASKNAYLEQFEGMLVKIAGTLTVTENYQLGRFGQVTLAAGGRPSQFTHANAPSTSGYSAHLDTVARQTIILDDHSNAQNPDPVIYPQGNFSANNSLRSGSTTDDLTGVLHYSWGGNSASPNNWRIRPTQAVTFDKAVRPTAPPSIGTPNVKVASFNVLNYFNTFGTGNCTNGVSGVATDCRGADDATEFTRQKDKHKQAFIDLNADVIGLMELENDGYGASSAQQDLLNLINSAGLSGRNYKMVDADTLIGSTNAVGTDAIKVGLIYDDNAMDLVAGSVKTSNDAIFDRPPLAATFLHTASGEKFTVVVNHFKSKGSAAGLPDDTDQGDGQGNSNATRTAQAAALVTFLSTLSDDPDILVMGDLNAYRMEDPITTIKNAGYTDLLGVDKYSYVYDGQVGYLDHALASASLVPQVTGADDWHINTDEPSVLDYNTNFKSAGQITSLYNADAYRSSDHDPVLIGLNLAPVYKLTLTSTGSGTVSSSATPAGSHCGTNCLNYAATSNVTLNATAASGYSFSGWSCNPTFNSGNTLTADTTCHATFVSASSGGIGASPPPPDYYMLSVTSVFAHIKSNPSGIDCEYGQGVCSKLFNRGQKVILELVNLKTATSLTKDDYILEWYGDDDCADQVVTMYNSRSCAVRVYGKPGVDYSGATADDNTTTTGQLKLLNFSGNGVLRGGAEDVFMGFILEGQGTADVELRADILENGVLPQLDFNQLFFDNQIGWYGKLLARQQQAGSFTTKQTVGAGAYTIQMSSNGIKGRGMASITVVNNQLNLTSISVRGHLRQFLVLNFVVAGEGTQKIKANLNILTGQVDSQLSIVNLDTSEIIPSEATSNSLIADISQGSYAVILTILSSEGVGVLNVDLVQ